jgi:hypothetical protein
MGLTQLLTAAIECASHLSWVQILDSADIQKPASPWRTCCDASHPCAAIWEVPTIPGNKSWAKCILAYAVSPCIAIQIVQGLGKEQHCLAWALSLKKDPLVNLQLLQMHINKGKEKSTHMLVCSCIDFSCGWQLSLQRYNAKPNCA